MRRHLTVEPRSVTQLRPAVPAEVAEALNRALAKTPADRFNPVGQFSEALGRGSLAPAMAGLASSLRRAPAHRLSPHLPSSPLAGSVYGIGAIVVRPRSKCNGGLR